VKSTIAQLAKFLLVELLGSNEEPRGKRLGASCLSLCVRLTDADVDGSGDRCAASFTMVLAQADAKESMLAELAEFAGARVKATRLIPREPPG